MSCEIVLTRDGGCAKGARAHPLEKKWLERSTGLKNDPQGRQVFPLAGTPLGKFLATLLGRSIVFTLLIFHINKLRLLIRSKNKNILPYPPKMIPEVCRIEKTCFQIYETFKGSFLGYTRRTFEYKTLIKFRRAEKGFIEKI